MKSNNKSIAKSLAMSFAILTFCAIGQSIARADVLTVNGTSSASSNVNGLTYAGGGFTGTIANGSTTSDPFALGVFSSPKANDAGAFTLVINISSLSSGDSSFTPATTSANYTGTATLNPNFLSIAFPTPTQAFFFRFNSFTSEGVGVYYFTVNGGIEFSDPEFHLTGQISTVDPTVDPTATPEPATMVLFGTGLVGVGAMVRKKRKAKSTEA